MTVEDLVLYAKNNQDLHEEQISMAVLPVENWGIHVRIAVLPSYRRELHQPYEGMTLDNLHEVAEQLREYYVDYFRNM